ncbi:MAG: DUF4156 domain-containing protein [Paludibacter sp.]|nr:DUF4156 domain-containing protein [Paludibacter sp.]
MKKTAFLVTLVVLFLSSCSPKITTSITKNYPLADSTQEVNIIEINEEVPSNSELLGEVRVTDSGFSTRCDYESVLNAAKLEARKAGGNTIRILTHQLPGMSSSCHQIVANIYKITPTDPSITPMTEWMNDSVAPVAQIAIIDTIQLMKLNGVTKYMYKGENLTMDRLSFIVQKNAKSLEYLNKAKSTSGLLNVMGFVGGALIGYPLGTLLGGGNPNWTLAAVGCGVLVVAIPIASTANNNVKKSIDTFNRLTPIAQNDLYYDIRFGIIQSGLGFSIKF